MVLYAEGTRVYNGKEACEEMVCLGNSVPFCGAGSSIGHW